MVINKEGNNNHCLVMPRESSQSFLINNDVKLTLFPTPSTTLYSFSFQAVEFST